MKDSQNLASMLKFYVYVPGEAASFLSDHQNKEYLQHASTISWVKSFKDVYKKYLQSARVESEQGESMSYFYLKHQTSIALFRTKNVDGKTQLVADLVASRTLIKEIKDKGIKYT